jgi:DNA-binding transcriptional LysR family regulator
MSIAADMEAFERVVELGGFTPAARALGLSPSAVSKLVARLEDRLGARLFRRTTRRLSLTEAGQAFHRHAQRIVADIADAELAVTRLSDAPRGLLRVSTATIVGHHQLQALVPEFLARYPEIKLELSLSDVYVDLVAEGFDLAIRAGALSDSTLVARKLGEFDRRVVAAPAYLERHGEPRTPADLARHNCLTFSHQTQLNQWPFRVGPGAAETEAVQVRGNYSSNNAETLFQLALGGLGILRMSDIAVGPAVRDGRLKPLLEDWASPDRLAFSAVYPSRRHVPPKVTAFVDFLAGKFLPHPPWAA